MQTDSIFSLSAFFRKASTAIKLPLREKIWVLLLYPLSGLIRASILFLPLRKRSAYLGRHYQNTQLCAVVSEQQRCLAWRIGRICELTARYTPWQSRCLVQATMASALLKYYGIPYIIYLGVNKPTALNREKFKTSGDHMKAHAWVSVGPWVICGGEGHKAFTIVSTFVSPSLLGPAAPSNDQ